MWHNKEYCMIIFECKYLWTSTYALSKDNAIPSHSIILFLSSLNFNIFLNQLSFFLFDLPFDFWLNRSKQCETMYSQILNKSLLERLYLDPIRSKHSRSAKERLRSVSIRAWKTMVTRGIPSYWKKLMLCREKISKKVWD